VVEMGHESREPVSILETSEGELVETDDDQPSYGDLEGVVVK
jgi:hypothetical protein